MKIQVTQADIDFGVKNDCHRCPVAIAIQRQTGVPYGVGSAYVDAYDKYIVLPKAAQEFIRRVDYAMPVEPFEFEITL